MLQSKSKLNLNEYYS